MSACLIPWAIAALYLLFLFPAPEFPPYNADDGSWFFTLGWNLTHYDRYTSDTYSLAEFGHHAAWPPLFAGLLAGVIKVFGLNWIVFTLVVVLPGLGVPRAAAAAALAGRVGGRLGGTAHGIEPGLPPAQPPHHERDALYRCCCRRAAGPLPCAGRSHGLLRRLAGGIGVLHPGLRGHFPARRAALFHAAPLSHVAAPDCLPRLRPPLLVAVLAWMGYTAHILAIQPLAGATQ